MPRRSDDAIAVIPTHRLTVDGHARAEFRRVRLALAGTPVLQGNDAVDTANDPNGAAFYSMYVDGYYPTVDEVMARWPATPPFKLSITTGYGDGTEIDSEPGNESWIRGYGPDPAGIATWMNERRAAGIPKPILYCSGSYAAVTVERLAEHGQARSTYYLHTAHWSGTRHICAPDICGLAAADLTQWDGNIGGPDGYDADEAYAYVFETVTPPAPPTKPPGTSPAVTSKENADMLVVAATGPTVEGKYGTVVDGAIFVLNPRKVEVSEAIANKICNGIGQHVPWKVGDVEPPADFVYTTAELADEIPNG